MIAFLFAIIGAVIIPTNSTFDTDMTDDSISASVLAR